MFERSFASLRMTLDRARAEIVIAALPDMRPGACAGKRFVANFVYDVAQTVFLPLRIGVSIGAERLESGR